MGRAITWAVSLSMLYMIGVVWFLELPLSGAESNDRLTSRTVITHVLGYFRRLEIRDDGGLTLDEYCRHAIDRWVRDLDRCVARFTELDADRNGRVTSDEMIDFYLSKLNVADRNGRWPRDSRKVGNVPGARIVSSPRGQPGG